MDCVWFVFQEFMFVYAACFGNGLVHIFAFVATALPIGPRIVGFNATKTRYFQTSAFLIETCWTAYTSCPTYAGSTACKMS